MYCLMPPPRTQVILNGVKFFGHGELFLESLRQVVEILSKSPEYKGGRSGRFVKLTCPCEVCDDIGRLKEKNVSKIFEI